MTTKFLSPPGWLPVFTLLFASGLAFATAQNMPVGNPERGQQSFQVICTICHSAGLGPGNTLVIKQGPTLLGVMGRKAGTSPHFNYTQALKDSGLVWDATALDRFLTYAKSKGDVWFARKDEIARYVLANRAGTPVVNRGSPSVTGLPGPAS